MATLTSQSTIKLNIIILSLLLLLNIIMLYALYIDPLASPFTCDVASLSFAYFTIRMRFLADDVILGI